MAKKIEKVAKLKSAKKLKADKPKKRGGENIIDRSIVDIATVNTKEYGAYTIEQRALADYRDGLKPVYRRLLWAMYNLSLHFNGPFKKSARTVGDTIGQYHPHGDAACYSAMVSMANSPEKLVDGQGNWGSYVDDAAAYRYTEARLTKYAEEYLLDRNYLAVADMVSNFSGDKPEPVILPAKLPNLLLNGSEGIATGVSSYIPSFDRAGVVKMVKLALKGTKIQPKHCLKYLDFKFTYGGECVSNEQELLNYFKSGNGTVYFRPSHQILSDRIVITSTAPRFNVENQLNKLAGLNGIIRVNDESDKEGIKFVLYLKRGIDAKEKKDLVNKFLSTITTSAPLQTAVTERHADETVSFKRTNIPDMLNDWIKWRIELEVKVINYLLKIENEKLDRLMLILKAVQNLKVVIASLESKDPQSYLVKHLKITAEQADFILDLKVRQLAKMETTKIKEQIDKCKKEISALKADLKNPAERILRSL